MKPEDIIQRAWAARADQDIANARAAGFWGKQVSWPVWAPEEAVKALLEAGWTPPGGGSETPLPKPEDVDFDQALKDFPGGWPA